MGLIKLFVEDWKSFHWHHRVLIGLGLLIILLEVACIILLLFSVSIP